MVERIGIGNLPIEAANNWAFIGGDDWGGLARVAVRMDGEPTAEGEANAHLIAAAPDLLAFVAKIANYDPVFAKGHEKQVIANARALVAKATGGA